MHPLLFCPKQKYLSITTKFTTRIVCLFIKVMAHGSLCFYNRGRGLLTW